MKKFIATILIISSQVILHAQCPPGNLLLFSSQAQIDEFKVNYPNCTDFDGDIVISGAGIINLYGLSELNSIDGNLQFLYVSGLTNMFGLEGLTTIGGSLLIIENYTLSNLMGLTSLSSVGAEVAIYNNVNLTRVNGLDSLSSVGLGFTISSNAVLNEVPGLNKLAVVGGNFIIENNPSLTDITGLYSLSEVMGNLSLDDLETLESVTGLEGLTSVGGDLSLEFNTILNDLSALDGLTSIGGDLNIRSNYALTTLAGLDNIDAGSINNLLMYSNTSLSTCEVLSICQYLASPNGTITISNNATGCDTQGEIEDACVGVDIYEPSTMDEVLIYPNPATSAIMIQTTGMPSDNSTITVLNTGGQLLIEQALTEAVTSIDISSFPPGVYFVKIRGRNSISVQKMIKQ